MTGLAAEAVAFGVPDAALGQAIVIVIRPANGDDAPDVEEALRARLRADLPNFMQPRHVMVWNDLPRNPNGKLDRVAITQQAKEELTS